MTDTQSEMQQSINRMFEAGIRAFGAPELDLARQSACPQQMYADLADASPVRDLGEGYFSLLSMEDILFVTRHPSVEQGSKYLGSDRPAIPLGLDGEEHRKYRRLLDPVFTAKKVAPLATGVRELAGRLIDGFIADGTTDAYATWCQPLPSTIFLSIMGLPMDDLDDFLGYKDLTLGSGDPNLSDAERLGARVDAVTWIQTYFNRSLDERENQAPRDDMIGWLLTTEVDGHRLTRQDVLDILGLLMIAGLDTVTASLACFLSYFARNPGQRQRIVEDRSLLRPAVEELMRFESPVIEGFREVKDDLTLPSGTTLPAGSCLHISWSAANLDPKTFDDPLSVDLERSPNPHIGFASGYHRCLGSHLARMEMVTALDVWHDRIPEYRIKGDDELRYTGNPRAPHRLPLTWS
ncbi:MAG: cytochrome P450 [Acidimicrobiales bacterium]